MAKRVTQAVWDAKRAQAKAKAREALAEQPEDEFLGESDDTSGEPQTGPEEVPYDEWSNTELANEVAARNLEALESREDTINQLEEDDALEEA